MDIALLGSFFGAISGVGCAGFWLATKFNHVYRKMADHELADEKRFNELKAEIVAVRVQAQALEAMRYR